MGPVMYQGTLHEVHNCEKVVHHCFRYYYIGNIFYLVIKHVKR